ncbi:MAG: 16S rRNA (guanine(527)-N(7))-methyltransferase RsmG [Rhodovibrionaceae bacterium]
MSGLSAYGAEDFARDLNVSRETLARFSAYAALLEKWNRRINLVGRDTLDDLWRRHFLDSAQLLPLLPAPPEGRRHVIADLGSGAGFPGLVLAILGAGEVQLIESDLKKCAFLREAARAADTEVTIHAKRIEEISGLQADLVTARALAPLDKLLDYARPLLRPGGQALFLKGRGAEQELTALDGHATMTIGRIPSRSDKAGVILSIEGL